MELLEAVLEMSREERSDFLDVECAGSQGLRERVESLLAAYNSAIDRYSFVLSWEVFPTGGEEVENGGGGEEERPGERKHGDSVAELPSLEKRGDAAASSWKAELEKLGPYVVERRLGQGGMGVVYLCRRQETGKLAAVKTLLGASLGQLQGMRREIRLLSRLEHPGIVQILEHGEEAGCIWFAMEYLEGTTLRERLACGKEGFRGARRGLSVPEGLAIVSELCHALAFLHGEGIVHRDIKPENVLLLPDGQPVLLDFGLTLRLAGPLMRDALDALGPAGGTPSYMAPEQIAGGIIDPRTDLYAVGCLLYEILAGWPPFHGETPTELLLQHLGSEPRWPDGIQGVPEGLQGLVMRLLEKEPQKRPGYALDIARHLEPYAAPARAISIPSARAYLYRSRLWGRRREMGKLGHALKKAERGRGGLLVLTGESGIGKTRLMLEIGARGQQRGFLVLHGEATTPKESGTPDVLPPIGPLLRPLRTLGDWCRSRGPGATEKVFPPDTAILFSYEPGLSGPNQADGSSAPLLPGNSPHRVRLILEVVRCLAAAADQVPILLLLDDLQWADAVTLDVLQEMLAEDIFSSRPLLLLASVRGEEMTDRMREIVERPSVAKLKVSRVDEDSLAAMASDMLGIHEVPEPLARFLVERSEGNPFFAAEALRAAISEEAIVRDPRGRWGLLESWFSREWGELGRSETVRNLIQARLHRLPDGARELLAAAAVLGREFDQENLERMRPTLERDWAVALQELFQGGILEETESGSLRFIHDQLREAAYQRLKASEKKSLHIRAAKLLEEIQGDDSLFEQGRHWAAAGAGKQATALYLEAGNRARAGFTPIQAEAAFRAALQQLDREQVEQDTGSTPTEPWDPWAQETLLQALRGLGLTLYDMGETEECHQSFQRALVICRRWGNRKQEANLLGNLADLYQDQGRLMEAEEAYILALQCFRELSMDKEEGILTISLACLRIQRSDYQGAENLLERARGIARKIDFTALEAAALGNLGNLAKREGDHEKATRLFLRSLELFRKAGNKKNEGHTLQNLAIMAKEAGRSKEALTLFEEALAIAKEIQNHKLEAIVTENLAELLDIMGHPARALALFQRTLAIHEKAGNQRLATSVRYQLAHHHREQGDLQKALEYTEETLAIVHDIDFEDAKLQGMTLLGMLRRESGDPDGARKLLEPALETARQQKELDALFNCLQEMASIYVAQGLHDKAWPLLDEAESISRSLGSPLTLMHHLLDRARMQIVADEPEQASATLREAQELFDTTPALKLQPNSWKARQLAKLRQELERRKSR